jgi:DNA-binding transcriptional ArsR family regulator
VGVLRIHFTGADLARTKVSAVPDPMWELMLSAHWLQGSYWRHTPAARPVFGDWRSAVAERLRRSGEGRLVGDLMLPLSPAWGYFPDFLTPAEGLLGLDAGIDAALSTPGQRLRGDLVPLCGSRNASSWLVRLASGERELLTALERVLRTYHRAVLEPYWPEICCQVETEHARCTQAVAAGGVPGMLAGLGPGMRWRPPVLEVRHPTTRDMYLHGRGLVLIPSYFCWTAIPLADPALPPVLTYAIEHRPDPSRPDERGNRRLRALLGTTRATILQLVEGGCTVSELATRSGVSVASASRHAHALREAGLVTSHRNVNTVTHLLTPLGSALLRGEL